MIEENSFQTQTLLSDNQQIKMIINVIIEKTAQTPHKFNDRMYLIDSLHLAMCTRLDKTEDDIIIGFKNRINDMLKQSQQLVTSKQISTEDGIKKYNQLSTQIFSDIDSLNKYVLKIANKIVNNKHIGKLVF